MQTSPHTSFFNSAPTIYRNKHGRDSEEEDAFEQQLLQTPSDNTIGGGLRGAGRVHFAADQAVQEDRQFPSAIKRRKTAHLDFEPVFQGLSLDSAQNGFSEPAVTQGLAGLDSYEADEMDARRGRGRRNSGRRETTPFPGSEDVLSSIAESEHRRRSTSRNRARVRSSSRDATMSRFDPSRPHVVYVDTLSDSEGDESLDPESSRSTTIPSTRNNSPSSDSEEVIPPSSSASRPIHLNRRLRDYIRKQQRGENGPVPEGILSRSPAVHGGAVDERGLVLYRPLSFGIVEEPEEQSDDEELGEDVRIQEIEPDGGSGEMIADEDTEMDGSMDVD